MGGIKNAELGRLDHYGNTCELKLQEDFLVSSASLVLARLTDSHNACMYWGKALNFWIFKSEDQP